MSRDTLQVSEEFYSIQGEGIYTGVPAVFLRLTGCNLLCPGWATTLNRSGCDTLEVWRRGSPKSFDSIAQGWIDQGWMTALLQGAHLVITGGEPLLQAEAIHYFLIYLEQKHQCHPFIEIETNSTVLPWAELLLRVNHWNVSPKLKSSGNPDLRFNRSVLESLASKDNAYFKFVVATESDVQEVIEQYQKPFSIRLDHISLMPMGGNQADLAITMPVVVELCKKYCFRFSPREHIMIWNKAVGV